MTRLILLAPFLGACTFLVGEPHPDDAAVSFPDFSVPCDPTLLTSDVRNCGACGRDCTLLPGVEPSRVRCVIGSCELAGACQAARGDCNAADGCETDLSTANNCGACGNVCSGMTPRCIGTATGSFTCAATCGGTTPTQCGAACVDTDSDPNHCGDCFNRCPVPMNGFALCDFFGCNFDCNPGFFPSGNQCLPNPIVDMSMPADLRMVDLRMVDLRMVDLRMVDLRTVDLAGVDLAGDLASTDDAAVFCTPTPCTMPEDCTAIPGCTMCVIAVPGFGICQ